MQNNEINDRLVAVGQTIKAKGWESAMINIFVQYLAMFNRDVSPLDPMISYQPSIRCSTRNQYGAPTAHEFVKDWHNANNLEEALEQLEAAADAMPRMEDEAARIESAKAKLSDDERRLLGLRA